MYFRENCRHFSGEKPCKPHKVHGLTCSECPDKSITHGRVLVIKLAAAGDVLRSTALLPALRRKHPGAALWWVTDRASKPLLEGHPDVDALIAVEPWTPSLLSSVSFEAVYCLDMSRDAAALASIASSPARYGFGLGSEGSVIPVHPAAEGWFEAGIIDQVKKANRDSYQSHLFRIAELEFKGEKPKLHIEPQDRIRAEAFVREHQLSRHDGLVGFNIGSGGRWPMKRWRLDGFKQLAGTFKASHPNWGILLFGGPEERDLLPELEQDLGDIAISAGANNSLRSFCGLIDLVKVLVSGDTLALHIGVALGKRVVAYFGPTSAAEIELYGLGEKVVPEVPCGCCYRNRCVQQISCMDSLREEDMAAALLRQVNLEIQDPHESSDVSGSHDACA